MLNQESELGEQLVSEGYTPLGNIQDLTSTQLLDKALFEYIFGIEDEFNRENIIADLQAKAKNYGIASQFNRKLRNYKDKYIKFLKSQNKNITNFTNCPINSLNCGNWIADDSGIYKKELKSNGQVIKVKASPIPILISERLINIDTKTEKVKLLFYKDGKWQDIITEKNTISSKNKILQLANRGIEVNEDNAKNLITYLSDLLELNDIPMKKGVSHLGWVDKNFIPYTDDFALDVDQEFNQKLKSIKEKGNLESWIKYVNYLREDNNVVKFLMSASFAGVLVKLFNINPFIVHLWGKSGNGKTLVEMVAASIWGNPNNSLISNLSNTTIANERLCNFFRNMPVFLDELQIAKTRYKSFDELIYALTEGKGKERGTIDNGLREITEWQTIIIFTGEEPITTIASKEGVKNRVIEINEDNNLIKDLEGNEVATFLHKNYGMAGKKFVEIVQEHFDEVSELQKKYRTELGKITTYKKQVNAMSLVMTANYISSKYIFKDEPLNTEDVKNYFQADTDEADRYFEMIMDWFSENQNKFVKNNERKDIGDIYGRYDVDENSEKIEALYIVPKVLRDFFNESNINFDSIKKKMFEKGYIEKDSAGKYQSFIRINGISMRCIKIITMTDIQYENEYEPTQEEIEDLPF